MPVGKGRGRKKKRDRGPFFPNYSSSCLAPRPQNTSKTGPGHSEKWLLVIFKDTVVGVTEKQHLHCSSPCALEEASLLLLHDSSALGRPSLPDQDSAWPVSCAFSWDEPQALGPLLKSLLLTGSKPEPQSPSSRNLPLSTKGKHTNDPTQNWALFFSSKNGVMIILTSLDCCFRTRLGT